MPTTTRLAGLSLPVRTVLSAQQAGIEEILILGGEDPAGWLAASARQRVRWFEVDGQSEIAALRAVREQLTQPFLLLFADSVVEPVALAGLRQSSLDGRLLLRVEPRASEDGGAASVFVASPELLARLNTLASNLDTVEQLWARCSGSEAGITRLAQGSTWERTGGARRLAEIEHELNRHYLKPTDGIHARFTKTVVAWPLIRFFLRTSLTPNFITGLGFVLAVLAGGVFAQGGYGWSLLGALLAYASAVMDHVDGMVARLRFQQSDFGTWFETAADYASYFFILLGLAVGLYRESGFWPYLFLGALFAGGALTSSIVLSRQRKRISGDKPADFGRRWHAKMEEHSDNFFHWFSRKCYFLARRGVMPYYVLLFCLLDLRGLLLGLCALAANLVWLLTLYNNRLFAPTSGQNAFRAPR